MTDLFKIRKDNGLFLTDDSMHFLCRPFELQTEKSTPQIPNPECIPNPEYGLEAPGKLPQRHNESKLIPPWTKTWLLLGNN